MKVWLVAFQDVEESKLAHTEYFLFLLHHLHCQFSRFMPCILCRTGELLNSHRSYALIPAPAGALVREQSAVEDLPATTPAKHNRLRLNLTSELNFSISGSSHEIGILRAIFGSDTNKTEETCSNTSYLVAFDLRD